MLPISLLLQEPPPAAVAQPAPSTSNAGSGVMGPSSILSAVRDRLTATASAAAERLAGALPGSPGGGGGPVAGGISTTTVACPSLVAGEWVAIALHHQVRLTLQVWPGLPL